MKNNYKRIYSISQPYLDWQFLGAKIIENDPVYNLNRPYLRWSKFCTRSSLFLIKLKTGELINPEYRIDILAAVEGNHREDD